MADEDVVIEPAPGDGTPLTPDPAAPLPPDPPNDPPSDPGTGVEEPAPPEATPVDPIELPPVMQEELARAQAWTEALQAAESTIGARVEAEKEAAREALREQGKLDENQIEYEVAQLPISFNINAEIRREAMSKVIQYVIADTPDGKPLRLNDNTTLDCAGDWELLDANDIDVLRSMEAMGYCKAIIRPPGWSPKAAK